MAKISFPKITTKQLGALGERVVAHALRQRGCRIVATNERTRYGEIDIIAKQNRTVIFVEVKTRRSGSYGRPEESITRRKRLHLYRASTHLAQRFARNCDYALLVVSVELDTEHGIARLTHIPLDA